MARVKPLPPTAQMLRFVDEYCVDFNGAKAAERAGYAKGASARAKASALLARDDIAELVAAKQKGLSEQTGINAQRVLQEIWGIATADVNELVEWRRTCCRHCYGIDYGYQRTVSEMNADRRAFEDRKHKAIEKGQAFDEDFDEQGGIGYDKRKDPNPDCQECFGEGVGEAYIKDTRTLSPEARALYAGVKLTKDGSQVLVIDKLAALEKLMKHLGQYKVDNEQKADGLKELLTLIQSRNTRLPIKEQR